MPSLQAEQRSVGVMSRFHFAVLMTRNETWRLWVCENSFPSFKTQISCLQYEASFLPTSQTKYCASL